jgi:hypothetical protein
VLRQHVRARFAPRVEQKKIRAAGTQAGTGAPFLQRKCWKKRHFTRAWNKKNLAIARACAIFRAD